MPTVIARAARKGLAGDRAGTDRKAELGARWLSRGFRAGFGRISVGFVGFRWLSVAFYLRHFLLFCCICVGLWVKKNNFAGIWVRFSEGLSIAADDGNGIWPPDPGLPTGRSRVVWYIFLGKCLCFVMIPAAIPHFLTFRGCAARGAGEGLTIHSMHEGVGAGGLCYWFYWLRLR